MVNFFNIPGGPTLPTPYDVTTDQFWALVATDTIAASEAVRPGLFDETDNPPRGALIESVNDGHLYWVHRDGTVHVVCHDGSGY